MILKKRVLNICKYFFLVIYLIFFLSTTFFDHAHLNQGNVIVHSHPFKPDKDGNPVHQHNNSCYFLIYVLNNYIVAVTVSFIFISLIPFLIHTISGRIELFFKSTELLDAFRLRGPPAAIIIP